MPVTYSGPCPKCGEQVTVEMKQEVLHSTLQERAMEKQATIKGPKIEIDFEATGPWDGTMHISITGPFVETLQGIKGFRYRKFFVTIDHENPKYRSMMSGIHLDMLSTTPVSRQIAEALPKAVIALFNRAVADPLISIMEKAVLEQEQEMRG